MSITRKSRSEMATEANWTKSGINHSGETQNLSVTGVYILSAESPEIDELIEISLPLPGASGEIIIKISGKVVRKDENGFALNFEEVDSKSYEHLTKLVAYQNTDPEKVFNEQRIKPGIKS